MIIEGKKVRLKLKTPKDIINSLNRIANWLMNEQISTDTARALTNVINSIQSAYKMFNQDEYLETLEDKIRDITDSL